MPYQGRSGLIALLHRLGMEHRKPQAISRKLDPANQAAFIKNYEALLNQLPADEAVMFADAVHPTHATRVVGCWAPKDIAVAITQSSGRERLNVHGAVDLEAGNTRMLEVLVVNAASTIMLLMAIEAMYPGKRQIHVFLDNARYHHAKLVQQWLPDPAALHPVILPTSRPDRTTVGIDAPALHPQQMLRWVQGFHARSTDFSSRDGAEKLARLLRPGHRQLPRYRSRRFSGSHVS